MALYGGGLSGRISRLGAWYGDGAEEERMCADVSGNGAGLGIEESPAAGGRRRRYRRPLGEERERSGGRRQMVSVESRARESLGIHATSGGVAGRRVGVGQPEREGWGGMSSGGLCALYGGGGGSSWMVSVG